MPESTPRTVSGPITSPRDGKDYWCTFPSLVGAPWGYDTYTSFDAAIIASACRIAQDETGRHYAPVKQPGYPTSR